MTYKQELTRSMTWLAKQPKTIFVGQAVEYPGTFVHDTLKGVPKKKRLEMPVAESFQMQFCMGLAYKGYIPICIFPRQNFMLHALGDIVNTLDKLPVGKVIIRVASGTTKPIYPGAQHVGDFRDQIFGMLENTWTISLPHKEEIFNNYERAYKHPQSFIIVEHGDMYGD